nr:vegetative incompatibility protein het-e-1 [Quercus suber]
MIPRVRLKQCGADGTCEVMPSECAITWKQQAGQSWLSPTCRIRNVVVKMVVSPPNILVSTFIFMSCNSTWTLIVAWYPSIIGLRFRRIYRMVLPSRIAGRWSGNQAWIPYGSSYLMHNPSALSLRAQRLPRMRLLHIGRLEFTKFHDDKRPPYVIASHRWRGDSEVTFQDVLKRRNTDKDGYRKIEAFAKYVRNHIPLIEWLWIDTCCINKDSAAELSEAINLMFEWYRNAEICLAYLADVETIDDKDEFEHSEWFKRGWTLQELLAPRVVIFVTKGWQVIGSKGSIDKDMNTAFDGLRLEKDIARITRIPEHVLYDFRTSSSLSIDQKLRWMESRSTTREEAISYALYGIFDVAPGANYGEKRERANQRLLAAIHHQDNIAAQQVERFRQIVEWLSPPEPWTNHASARDLHEPQTGTWLMQSDQYSRWKSASVRHLWLHGKAGCGKTILCSTVVEDLKEHCKHRPDTVYAVFYFSFSDDKKQRTVDLYCSLVAQLGWKGPALSMLQQMHDIPYKNLPGLNVLEKILFLCFEAHEEVFLLLDALDECPEGDDVRHIMLERLAKMSQRAPHVKILATSREMPDIRECMVALGSEAMPLATNFVNADIQQYVSMSLSRDHQLSRLDATTKELIERTISARADGMFRWAYCQLQELKRLPDTRLSYIRKALYNLPATLDETYARIITGIGEAYRSDALTLLRWLAYARSPPTLGQLAETVIIDIEADRVNIDDRGSLEGTLNILSGLVTVVTSESDIPNELGTLTEDPEIIHGA